MSKRGWVRVLVAVLTAVGVAALAAVATAKDTSGPTRPTGGRYRQAWERVTGIS